MRRHPVLRVFLFLLLLALVVFLAIFCSVLWKQAHVPKPDNDFDAIIVLGAQVKPNGEPSLQLQWRLDAAFDAYQGHPCPIVVCGAKGSDEPDAEAHVMAAILRDKGIPEADILQDDSSFNTRQNLRNASQLLETLHPDTVLVVTSDYHLPRALALAQDEGFRAVGIGSPTLGGYWWLKNHARESLAWVKYWLERYLNIRM